MKDAYSFDLDEQGLDASFTLQHEAYSRIFKRMDLQAIPVEASSGNMGGSDSVEFMVRADSGEDKTVICAGCGYGANIEKAVAYLEPVTDENGPEQPEKFATPGIRTIAELASSGHLAHNQIKTMVYVIDGQITLALLRGDHQLNEQKLADATGATLIRQARNEETLDFLGAEPGSLGAVGVSGCPIYADNALKDRTNMVTGANENDYHFSGVSMERDITVAEWVDLREVQNGDLCLTCMEPLDIVPTIESGHIFKLGTKYAETFGVNVLDENGKSRTVVMGSYGIGVERAMATIVETHFDDKGIVWPLAVAPFEVIVTIVQPKDDENVRIGEQIYDSLLNLGIEVLLDDRDARPGVKFADAELIGVPYRVTIGPKGIADGVVEFAPRANGEATLIPIEETPSYIAEIIQSAK
tara:strand:+ start:114 stop:1352 length:1239 start_codon:yes stop_codon:yes gene_type:complete